AQTPVPTSLPFSSLAWNCAMNKVTGNVDGQVSWNSTSGAVSYKVSEYIQNNSGQWVAYGANSLTAPSSGRCTIQGSGLLPGSVMMLVTEAVDANWNLLSFSSGELSATSQTAISNISNANVTSPGAQSMSEQLSWSAVAGAQFYRVYQWDPISNKY